MDKAILDNKIRPFSVIDQHNLVVSSEDLLKHKYVVLYFYPKDNTPG